ncbi:hypothetical protein FRC08_016106 [Ceratobasidium sp. 394]|nr:hypothetical protein FRC08_016106 [Ceratobasidium sp. 394]KAG9089739.1 hypothetical protein FS749_001099 [Ceratobasidium sp. UAMH 11750]
MDISQLNQNDVLESTLFAQLAASAKFNAFNNPKEWYEAFFGELAKIAWTNTELDFVEASLSAEEVAVSQLVVDFLGSVGEAIAVSDLIYTQQHLDPTNGVAVIFNQCGKNASLSNFQLGTVTQVGTNIGLVGGAFYYQSAVDITQVLFAELCVGKASFFQSKFNSILNLDLYAQGIREAVKTRLEAAAATYIATTPLANAP